MCVRTTGISSLESEQIHMRIIFTFWPCGAPYHPALTPERLRPESRGRGPRPEAAGWTPRSCAAHYSSSFVSRAVHETADRSSHTMLCTRVSRLHFECLARHRARHRRAWPHTVTNSARSACVRAGGLNRAHESRSWRSWSSDAAAASAGARTRSSCGCTSGASKRENSKLVW